MIKLENKANVMPPDADYPYGAIKNDTGTGDGTPVDVQVYGDIHQFFARLFAISGLTSNGLPDNLTNGFQLYDAFEKLAGLQSWTALTTPILSVDTGTITAGTSFINKIRIQGKTLEWQCIFSATLNSIGTSISVNIPSAITSLTIANNTIPRPGTCTYFSAEVLPAVLNATTGKVTITRGAAFPNGSLRLFGFSFRLEIA
ncbi:MAG: hypothetical protein BGO31_00160 [Bacteroidetes bacterium 43-16]|uniref:hypothetical protein n=1 Tax=uncultured Dysgonomonas sp. TaxID=206096 RepID=UPI0009290CCF|nr:hypothetical protein [uncultured Dysgonomonas sp.]OJV51652.1 MAG: hypothetical protein BGO31_00160 [Bacteroidetes bacterium 43-16]